MNKDVSDRTGKLDQLTKSHMVLMSALHGSSAPVGKVRMPAEYEPHRGTWLLWPERPDNWRLNAEPGRRAAVQLAKAISKFERVTVGVSSGQYPDARERLPNGITLPVIDYNDTWIRDTGPICVVDEANSVWGTDWRFNSWGGLFESWAKDDSVAQQVLQVEKIPRLEVDIVLEGGAIAVDGLGTLLTTEECVLASNRNPGVTKRAAEEIFREHLGITKVIWIPRGLHNDEAGGHIDNLCAFVKPGGVVLAWSDDPSDPQYERCTEALKILSRTTDARGMSLEIAKLPLPAEQTITHNESRGFAATAGTISRSAGDILPASYVNFYFVNGGLIVPAFGDEKDEEVVRVLSGLCWDREIVTVPSREFLLGGGAVHCLTQQIPVSGSSNQR